MEGNETNPSFAATFKRPWSKIHRKRACQRAFCRQVPTCASGLDKAEEVKSKNRSRQHRFLSSSSTICLLQRVLLSTWSTSHEIRVILACSADFLATRNGEDANFYCHDSCKCFAFCKRRPINRLFTPITNNKCW